jgi:HrpA-like RNA helicase
MTVCFNVNVDISFVFVLQTYSQVEKAAEFLSQMPEPPPPESVTRAVLELIHLGALDENEKLTPLGRRIAMFTTHPKLSKALVHATIFRYLYLTS